MRYRRSIALQGWLVDRREELRVIEQAHRVLGQNPPGDPGLAQRVRHHLAQAFILRIYAEFQAFVRELHDVAADAVVRGLGVPPSSVMSLVSVATFGRGIDQGNAGLRVIVQDFNRLGVRSLRSRSARLNQQHGGDQREYENLTRLRNAIAHGNSDQVEVLWKDGIRPTLTYGRTLLPHLNRMARALDRAVWDHVRTEYPSTKPW